MNKTTKLIDPRIIPTVRNLKDQPQRRGYKSKTNVPEETHKNNIQEIYSDKEQQDPKNKFSPSSKSVKKNINDKIYIDGSFDPKTKQTTSYNKQLTNSKNRSTNKIKIVSKSREIIEQNPLLLSTMKYTKSNFKNINFSQYNNYKSRTKYVQNLLNSNSIKKYKQNFLDLIKNDNEIKSLYEICGFDKTNVGYENFIYKNFFDQELFMMKLEMLFLDEKNFVKKNFKENFFKKELKKFLSNCIENNTYKKQISNLNDTIKETFNLINDFDLFHD